MWAGWVDMESVFVKAAKQRGEVTKMSYTEM